MSDAEQERPHLTISAAAKAAGVDRRTIRRRLDADELPNAYRADGPKGPGTGPWTIPVTDLIAAGLHLHASKAPDIPVSKDEQSELDRLRTELAEERTRRRVAEAVADERAHALERADAAISALRALTAGPDTEHPSTNISTPARGRRWWRR